MILSQKKIRDIFSNLVCSKYSEDFFDLHGEVDLTRPGNLISEKNQIIDCLHQLGYLTNHEYVLKSEEKFMMIYTKDNHIFINWEQFFKMLDSFGLKLSNENNYILVSIKYDI